MPPLLRCRANATAAATLPAATVLTTASAVTVLSPPSRRRCAATAVAVSLLLLRYRANATAAVLTPFRSVLQEQRWHNQGQAVQVFGAEQ